MGELARVFAYGTLEFSELLEAVAGRVFPRADAVLDGYARYALFGRNYPGLVAEPGAKTHGTLLTGIDAESLLRIDEFEDDFYERRSLPVVANTTQLVEAYVYVIPERHRAVVSNEPWSPQDFERLHLADYLSSDGSTDGSALGLDRRIEEPE